MEPVCPTDGQTTSENINGSWTGIIGMLQRGVWIAFAVVVVMLCILGKLLLMALSYSDASRSDGNPAFFLAAFLMQGYGKRVTHPTTMVFGCSTLLYAMLFSVVLLAFLNTSLVVDDDTKIRTLSEVARRKVVKPIIAMDQATRLKFKDGSDHERLEIYQRAEHSDTILSSQTGLDEFAVYQEILYSDPNCVVIGPRSYMSIMGNILCNAEGDKQLFYAMDVIERSMKDTAISKLISEEKAAFIRRVTSIMASSGITTKLRDLLFQFPSCLSDKEDDLIGEELMGLPTISFYYSFYLYGAGLCLSTASFVFEFIVAYWTKRKRF